MDFSLSVNARGGVAYFDAVARRQLPFAIKNALNKTAKTVIEHEKQAMQTAFAAPKSYTLNSLFVRKYATKSSLSVVVDFKDGGRGRSAGKYLAAQIHGGARRAKAVESFLIGRGLMPPGCKIVPAAVRLDRHGNISLGAFRAMVRGVDAGTHFALHRQHGALAPGIYRRRRGGVIPLIIYVSSANYRKQFLYFEIAERSINQSYSAIFSEELSRALLTAR